MWLQIQQSLVQSIERVTTKIATLVPGIVAFVLALIIFAVVSWLFAMLMKRILVAAKFDERISEERGAIAEWSPRHTPTLLITRTIFWCGIIIGVLVGVSAFEAASAESGISAYIFAYVPRVIGAAILLFAGNVIARFLSRSVLIGAVNMNMQYARLLGLGVKWLVLVLAAAMALDHLAIGGQIVDLAFGILFGGIVLALSLSVGLGSRELVSRSLEREASRSAETPMEERQIHHF